MGLFSLSNPRICDKKKFGMWDLWKRMGLGSVSNPWKVQNNCVTIPTLTPSFLHKILVFSIFIITILV